MSTSLHTEITATIIEALTAGGLPPWRKSWSCDPNSPGLHTSLSSGGRPYRGINQLILMCSAMKNNFHSRWWATFNQIKQQGGSVLRGSKSTTVVLYRPVERTKVNDAGKEVDDSFFVMRSFRVFNADQTTLEQFQVSEEVEAQVPFESYEHADQLIDDIGADIRYGGNQAFYTPQGDYIQLPHRTRFSSPEAFYETCFHEHIHYTEHESRLNWDRKNEGYAMGELIAEMGACFMMAELGLPVTSSLDNHAAYLKHWLKGMEDEKFIFKASSQASKAVAFLMDCSTKRVEEREPAIIV
ncbi:ArdC family protein [Rubripirellula reticaptiva]|uniref:DNA primase TraC n=1 Tax=Rubripirellula reticaptiva TaxID=2528013 RepID=A0A5C6ELN1_9BACT|nr:zincin-like metallopeptidase domain-containing protein [Rubripirellula reticaptiva]TWU49300.1 DNA primase TraC [Rubripirellula reticaptiva]